MHNLPISQRYQPSIYQSSHGCMEETLLLSELYSSMSDLHCSSAIPKDEGRILSSCECTLLLSTSVCTHSLEHSHSCMLCYFFVPGCRKSTVVVVVGCSRGISLLCGDHKSWAAEASVLCSHASLVQQQTANIFLFLHNQEETGEEFQFTDVSLSCSISWGYRAAFASVETQIFSWSEKVLARSASDVLLLLSMIYSTSFCTVFPFLPFYLTFNMFCWCPS